MNPTDESGGSRIASPARMTGVRWRKAGLSMSNSHCVQVRSVIQDGVRKILMRDSKDPDGPVLTFTVEEWDAFSGGMDAGNFSDIAGREQWIVVRQQSLAGGLRA